MFMSKFADFFEKNKFCFIKFFPYLAYFVGKIEFLIFRKTSLWIKPKPFLKNS